MKKSIIILILAANLLSCLLKRELRVIITNNTNTFDRDRIINTIVAEVTNTVQLDVEPNGEPCE